MSFNSTYAEESGEINISPYSYFSLNEQTNEIRQKTNIQTVISFLQKVVKNSLNQQNYKQIGRLPKYFNTKEK